MCRPCPTAAQVQAPEHAGTFAVLQVLPHARSLDSAFVASNMLDAVEAAAQEALDSGAWTDAAQVLPPVLSAADIASLLAECPIVQGLGTSKPVCRAVLCRLLSMTLACWLSGHACKLEGSKLKPAGVLCSAAAWPAIPPDVPPCLSMVMRPALLTACMPSRLGACGW